MNTKYCISVQNADLHGYRYRRLGFMINGAEERGGVSDIGNLEQRENREKEKSNKRRNQNEKK